MAHITRLPSHPGGLSIVIGFAFGLLACGGTVTGGGASTTSSSSSGGGAGGSTTQEPCESANSGASISCTLPGQGTGFKTCELDGNNTWAWTSCQASSSESTPLVLVFDGAAVTFSASVGAFDLASTMSVVTDWPTARTPWLARDRDGNGSIDDGSELFGSATKLATGARAKNGFEALAELDSNGDGLITSEDAAWPSLRLWADADGDRVSTAAELSPLAGRRVLAIDLRYTSARHCDDRDNCEVERASFTWADESGAVHTGAVVDVHLRHQAAR
jgi:hypothetical protein